MGGHLHSTAQTRLRPRGGVSLPKVIQRERCLGGSQEGSWANSGPRHTLYPNPPASLDWWTQGPEPALPSGSTLQACWAPEPTSGTQETAGDPRGDPSPPPHPSEAAGEARGQPSLLGARATRMRNTRRPHREHSSGLGSLLAQTAQHTRTCCTWQAG